MDGTLSRLITALEITMKDPSTNPTQTVLVVGVITAIFLILVLFGLTAYYVLRKRFGRKSRIVLPMRELSSREVLISWAVLLTLLIGVYMSVDSYTSRPTTCMMCHSDGKQAKALKASTHKSVRCMACHQRPGVTGNLAQKVDYTRWILYFPSIQQSKPGVPSKVKFDAVVADQSCLRCHGEVSYKTVRWRQIKVRHSDIIEAGYRCVDCHNTVAHLDTIANQKKPSMDKCIMCHDGKRASSKCETCHVTSSDLRKLPIDYTRRTFAPPENCRGCHNVQAECTSCHGVEMPHPAQYKKKYHAIDGLMKKDICRRCHNQEKFCNKCHYFPSPHGPSSRWAKLHGGASQRPDFGVFWGRVEERIKGCNGCHRGNMCDACHADQRRPAKPQ